jgi:DNA polymerase/3'-5' exonuclease PolX
MAQKKERHMELEKAKAIAEELKTLLETACKKIVVAGSIRRCKPFPNDVELLCIPRFVNGIDQLDETIKALVAQGQLDFRRNKLGSRVYGPKNKLMAHLPSGIGVDVFSTDEECWWVSLVMRTGGEVTNKRIAMAAIRKGWHLKAYGRGFSAPDGELVCSTERDVFEFVGLAYKEPWERE